MDIVLFPEGYIKSSDKKRIKNLRKLTLDLGAPLLVGAVMSIKGTDAQILLRFDPDGSKPSRLYTKHTSSDRIAFDLPDWNSRDMLRTFELGSVKTGATLCHDHYLGLLQRSLAKNGAHLWLNPSGNNVRDSKWSSVLRLRAVENRLFALCTLHDDYKKRTTTHPFAFSPDGNELCARKAGSTESRPISECKESDTVYIVDLDIASASKQFDWSNLPCATKPQRPNENLKKPVRVSIKNGLPVIYAKGRWRDCDVGSCIETEHGKVYVGMVRGKNILDAAVCFHIINSAYEMECRPIIWNHWKRIPTEPERLANLMMGRVVECCAPIVISDKVGIHELVELSNSEKDPIRRTVKPSEAVVDVGRAWGMSSAFKMVTDCLSESSNMETALELYKSLR